MIANGLAWGCGGSGKGSATTCNSPAPCGGALDGTWQIDSVCNEGDLAAAMASQQGLPAACSQVFESASMTGTGTITLANGAQTNNVVQKIAATAVYTPECITALTQRSVTFSASICSALQQQLANSSGVSQAACSLSGSNCTCSLAYENQASSDPMSYTVSGNTVTYTSSEEAPLTYCVAGTTMTVSQAVNGLSGITLHIALHKL